jgi:hypothetical protein
MQVLLEIVRFFPGRAIDAREHLVVLVTAPVGPGDRHQFDGGRVDLPGIVHVRATTEVHERIMLIDRYLRFDIQRISVLVEAALFQSLDQFQFIRLAFEDFARFLGGQHFLLEVVMTGDDLAHAFFKLGQILLRDRLRQLEIVVKAVLDRRTDRVLGFRKFFQDGLRHDMRR